MNINRVPSENFERGINRDSSVRSDRNPRISKKRERKREHIVLSVFLVFVLSVGLFGSFVFADDGFNVTYYGNDNTGGTGPGTDFAPVGYLYTVLGPGDLIKDGFTFDSWNTQPNGSGTRLTAGWFITVTADMALYAQWKPIPTVTVTYNGNGNTGGTVPGPDSVFSGSTYTVCDAGNLTRTDYIFTGWNSKSDGSGIPYDFNQTITVSANLTLFAQWSYAPYVVNYVGNGNTGGAAPGPDRPPVGYLYTVRNQGSLVKRGHFFTGWNTSADGTGIPYNTGSNVTVSANLTLFAQWEALPDSVTYDGNGSTGGTVPGPDYPDPADTYYIRDAGGLVKDGFTFDGWNSMPDGSGNPYSVNQAITVSGHLTLFAQWRSLICTVTYDGNGNTGGTVPDPEYPETGSTYTVPGAGSLTKYGFVFAGWDTRPDGMGTRYAPSQIFTVLNDLTLYAQWTPSPYSVTYNGNGNTGGTALGPDYPDAGSIYSVRGASGLTKSGFTFDGWNSSINGSGSRYTANQPITVSGHLILYAQWKPVTETVTGKQPEQQQIKTVNPKTGNNTSGIWTVTIWTAALGIVFLLVYLYKRKFFY